MSEKIERDEGVWVGLISPRWARVGRIVGRLTARERVIVELRKRGGEIRVSSAVSWWNI